MQLPSTGSCSNYYSVQETVLLMKRRVYCHLMHSLLLIMALYRHLLKSFLVCR